MCREDIRVLAVQSRALPGDRHGGIRRLGRGAATVAALSGAALLLWSSFEPAAAASASALDEAQRREFRSQTIAPLGRGGDTGRRIEATAAVVRLAGAPERPSVQLTATLGQGDGFGRMLQRAGVGAAEAQRIAGMVSSAVTPGELAPGTRFSLTLGRRASATQPRPLESLTFRARLDLSLAVERRGAALTLVRKPIAVDATPLRIRGIVGASLYRSARAAGAPAKAVQQYLRALDGQLDLSGDVLPSDQFDIVVDHRRAATGEIAVGDLAYAGLERSGRPRVRLLRWDDGRFYEASGVGERKSGLTTPVAGRITSGFGLRRHPILGYVRMHSGVDFRARWGSPIYAAADGTVTYAGRRGGHGNHVRLAHDGGIGTGYSHLSRIAVGPGLPVRRGQVIGYVGSTGLSTGPHLHYELYRGGRAVDPGAGQLLVSRAELEGAELAAFRSRLETMLQVTPGIAGLR